MKLFHPLILCLFAFGCKENLSPPSALPDRPVFKFSGAELWGCTDDTGPVVVGYVRGCAILGDDGRRVPGDHEYGPLPVDSLKMGRWFVRWAYFENVERIQAMLCRFDVRINDWACSWNWVTFTSVGPEPTAFEPVRVGVRRKERGDWSAYFIIRETGKFRVILRGEAGLDSAIADTLSFEFGGSVLSQPHPFLSDPRLRSEIRLLRVEN